MVGKTGFEPATPWSQTKCSTKLSHFPIYGAPNRSRTHNLLIRSQTLYPIELWAHMFITNKITCAQNYIFKMVASVGIEPTTPRFSVLCSANWAMKPQWRFRRELNPRSLAWQASVITATPRNRLVAGDGFEPPTFGLWAQRATRLLYPAMLIYNGGWRGIWTPAPISRSPGFQDRSLQPDLGIPP